MVDKSVVVRLNALTGQYQAEMGAAAATTAGFSRTVQGAAASAGSSVSAFGKIAGNVGKITTLGIAAGLALSAKAAIEFESSFAGVRKTVDATEPQFAALAGSIRQLSTEIPIGVNELNRIAELGGQLGVQVGGLPEFVETIGQIGVTTNLSVEDAALAFARLDNILQLGGDSFEELGSTLVDLGNNFAATESEITTFALRIAPIGATVGLAAEDVLALATAFASVGVPAERGGTAIQKTFIRIAEAVKDGGARLDTFARIAGTSAGAFAELFEADPARAFEAFIKGLERINDEGGNVFAVLDQLDLNNQRVIASLLAMANASDVLTTALDTSEDAWEANLALTEEAEKRFDTTASRIELAKNQVNDLAIEMGQRLLPILGDIADGVGDFLAGLESLDPVLQKIIIGVGLLVTGVTIGRGAFLLFSKVIGVDFVANMALATGATIALQAAIGAGLLLALGLIIGQVVKVGQANRDAEAKVNALTEAFEAQRSGAADAVAESIALNLITDDVGEAMLRLGFRTRTFAQALAGDEDALNKVRIRLGLLQEKREELARGRDVELLLQDEILTMTAAERQMRGLGNVIEDLAVVEAFLANNLGLVATARDNEAAARELDIMAELIETGGELGDHILLAGIRAKQAEGRHRGFADSLILEEDVLDDVNDAVAEYSDAVAESMQETAEATRENVISWDEWKEGVELNLDAVLDGMQKRLTAETRFFREIEQGLAGDASPAVIEFLNLLSSEEKFAFLEFPEADKAEFIAGVEAFIAATNALVEEKLAARLPEIIQLKGAALLTALQGLTEEIVEGDKTGTIDAIDAWQATIEGALLAAEPGLRAELLGIFGSEFGLEFIGLMTGLGSAGVQGLLDGIIAKYGAAAIAGAGLARKVVQGAADKFDVESPSKVMAEMGVQVAEGLTMGIDQGLRNFSGIQLSSIGAARHQLGSQARSMVTTNNQGDRSMVVNVNQPRTSDLSSDLAAGLIGGGVVEVMEAR